MNLTFQRTLLKNFFTRERIPVLSKDKMDLNKIASVPKPSPEWFPKLGQEEANTDSKNPFYPTRTLNGYYRGAKYSLRRTKKLYEAARKLKEAGEPQFLASLPPVPQSILPKAIDHIGTQKMWGGKTLYDKFYKGHDWEKRIEPRKKKIAKALEEQDKQIKTMRHFRRVKRQGKTYPF